jgi:hypothetical protein
MVAPMKTRPLAVTSGPPMLGSPSGRPDRQRRHVAGGAERHLPAHFAGGEVDRHERAPGRRVAGRCRAGRAPRSRIARRACPPAARSRSRGSSPPSSRTSSRGTSVIDWAARFRFITTSRRPGSHATPPQFTPPAVPGTAASLQARRREDPLAAQRRELLAADARSQGVRPNASPGRAAGGMERRRALSGRAASAPSARPARRSPARGAPRREERRAGLAVEQEQVPHLGGLRERGHRAPGLDLEQRRLRGDVVVPEVVVHGLEVPAHGAVAASSATTELP